MNDVVRLWLWYMLAFDAGAAVMALVVTLTVRARTADEAVERTMLAREEVLP